MRLQLQMKRCCSDPHCLDVNQCTNHVVKCTTILARHRWQDVASILSGSASYVHVSDVQAHAAVGSFKSIDDILHMLHQEVSV